MSEHVSVTTLLCNLLSCVRTEASSDKLRPVRVSARRNAALSSEASWPRLQILMIPHSSLIIATLQSERESASACVELIIEGRECYQHGQ